MTYLFALVGIIAIAYLIWRAFGPAAGEERPTTPGGLRARKPRGRTLGPDDDPEFLRDLSQRAKRPDSTENEDI